MLGWSPKSSRVGLRSGYRTSLISRGQRSGSFFISVSGFFPSAAAPWRLPCQALLPRASLCQALLPLAPPSPSMPPPLLISSAQRTSVPPRRPHSVPPFSLAPRKPSERLPSSSRNATQRMLAFGPPSTAPLASARRPSLHRMTTLPATATSPTLQRSSICTRTRSPCRTSAPSCPLCSTSTPPSSCDGVSPSFSPSASQVFSAAARPL